MIPALLLLLGTPLAAFSDDCATPVSVGSSDVFDYVTAPGTDATTGAEGQANAACNHGGSAAITGDIWITWTPPITSGSRLYAQVSAITYGEDIRIAVYDGSGCPAAVAIACGDDTSAGSYPVVKWQPKGGTYTIQIGTTTGAAENESLWIAGSLAQNELPTGQLDWQSYGASAITGTAIRQFVVRPLAAASSTRIQAISVFLGEAIAVSGAFKVEVWDDPNDDGDIADRVLVRQVDATKLSATIPTIVDLGTPVVVTGSFAIACLSANSAGQNLVVYSCGTTGFQVPAVAQRVEVDGKLFTMSELSAVGFSTTCGTPGARLAIRYVAEESFNSTYPLVWCDGASNPCPCGNVGGPMRGCASSMSTRGAFLGRYGPAEYFATPDIDKLYLVVDNVGTSTCILSQGTLANTIGVVFGDGTTCLAGTVTRLYTKTATAGRCDFGYPNSGETIGEDGGLVFPIAVTATQSRSYQVMYRDPDPSYCTVESAWNFSNTIGVTWWPADV